MARAYDIAYLEDTMTSVGAMLDYAVNACGEDLGMFYDRFLGSGIADMLFRAHPRYIAGCSGIELAETVARRTGKPLAQADAFIDIGSPEYWTGWTLAYLTWYLNIDFRTLQERGVAVDEVYRRYPALHEADLSKSVHFAQKQLDASRDRMNPLKTARENAGMTQRELAEASGASLRAIRAYEQGQLSLQNAESKTTVVLSRILGCKIQHLIFMDDESGCTMNREQ